MAPSLKDSAEVEWPPRWQREAIEAVTPYIGSDERLRIVVDDPEAAIHGTVIEGHIYVENRTPTVITTEAVGPTSSRGDFSADPC